jgi:glycosyltransferase involved in cell wall biosynthesis
MKISQRVAESDCEIAMVHYHGEHWLFPFFYYQKQPIGVVYVNVIPPIMHKKSLPFQESTLQRRIADNLLRMSHVEEWGNTSLRSLYMLCTPSNYVLQHARKQGIVGQRKTRVVPLGVDHSEFSPTGEEEPFALYLGRIHPHKSLELAILSMKDTDPSKSLIIAGDLDESNHWYKSRLEQIAEKAGISDRLQIILFPSDLQVVRLMQKCSVFLFPSTIDTFGLVVLEAMACGKPIVACRRGGVPETIGDAGFLLEPIADQWQKTVSKLLSDSELRSSMGRKALERSKEFSWENSAQQLLYAFHTLNSFHAD